MDNLPVTRSKHRAIQAGPQNCETTASPAKNGKMGVRQVTLAPNNLPDSTIDDIQAQQLELRQLSVDDAIKKCMAAYNVQYYPETYCTIRRPAKSTKKRSTLALPRGFFGHRRAQSLPKSHSIQNIPVTSTFTPYTHRKTVIPPVHEIPEIHNKTAPSESQAASGAASAAGAEPEEESFSLAVYREIKERLSIIDLQWSDSKKDSTRPESS